jgi:hypothetical protein
LQHKRRGACNAKRFLFATGVKKDGAYWWMGVEFQVDQTIHRLIGFPQQCLGVHEHMGSIYQLHCVGEIKNEKLNLQILKKLKMVIK